MLKRNLLIFCMNEIGCGQQKVLKTNNDCVNISNKTYGAKVNKIMYLTCLAVIWTGLSLGGALADFPGQRRPPAKQDPSVLLQQIESVLEHHARMRLVQQLAQMSREKAMADLAQSEDMQQPSDGDYQLVDQKDDAPFAYTPNDPRYYQTIYKLPSFESEEKKSPVLNDGDQYETLKAPMLVNPKLVAIQNSLDEDKASKGAATSSSVVQKPINMDEPMGLYVVAITAGVSAAVTVALIALGLAWYTLRQKIKAAADVEYPAYGVTGPSKDFLYPNDKKFEQSVDMYHYQQQKQKKMSLEKQSNGETNDGFSDLEGEYEIEDGDYTVYECPGFAPTGEMEVKNPLFADEPITVAQKHQPPAKAAEEPRKAKGEKSKSPDKKSKKK